MSDTEVKAAPVPLWLLFWEFLRIGSTAFGGFMGLIAVLQSRIVDKRRLLTHEEMLDAISLATLLPGPVAVNVVAYVGYRLRGSPGAALSMLAVILPAFLLILGLSIFYLGYGRIPAVNNAFAGLLPAVVAIIVATVWNLGRKTLKTLPEFTLAALAAALLLGLGGFTVTLAIITVSGAVGWLLFRDRAASSPARRPSLAWPSPGLALILILLGTLIALFLWQPPWIGPNSVAQLLVTFSGISLLLFGGGFVFIPLIQTLVVEGRHWVTQPEFAAAIAMGQVTPGPILLSAAFIGYKVQGLWGAVVATLGIFTPSAIVMILASRLLVRLKSSHATQAIMRGIRAAVVGMILTAAVVIARTVEPHWLSLLIFAAALPALTILKIEAVWIIPSAAVLGLLFYS